MVGVSGGGGSSSAFSVYKACSLLLVLRWLALLLPAGLGGEGVVFEFVTAVLGLEGAGLRCLLVSRHSTRRSP
jgi:hypothetical protein